MAENALSKTLQRVFWGIFILCFALALALCLPHSAAGILCVLGAAAALVGIALLCRWERIKVRWLTAAFGVALAATLAIQVWMAVNRYIVPSGFDMEAVYTAVKEIAENGHMVESDWYFVSQPFQAFVLFQLYALSHLLMLLGAGTPLPYTLFTLFTALCVDAALLLFMATVRLYKGGRAALAAGFACLLFSSVRYGIVYVYTHTLATPYLFAGLFVFALARRREKPWQRLLLTGLSALLLGLAALMAGSVVIVLVAALITLVLAGRWKALLLSAMVLLAGYLLVYQGFHLWWERSGYVDTSSADEISLPPQHWLVLGLSDHGAYNEEDYFEAIAVKGYANKVEFLNKKLLARLEARGVGGVLALWGEKIRNVWARPPYEGSLSPPDTWLNTGLMPAMLLMLLPGAVRRLRRPEADLVYFLPALALLGLFLFLLAWEANNHYTYPYIFFMAPLALDGAACLGDGARNGARRLLKKGAPHGQA